MSFSKSAVDPLWDTFAEIEHEFIMEVAQLLQDQELLQIWTDQPFRGQELLKQKLDKIINKKWNTTARKDIKKAFEQRAKTTLSSDEKAFKYAYKNGKLIRKPVGLEKSKILQRILQEGFTSVQERLKISLSIARASTIARLNQTVLRVAEGKAAFNKALKEAVQDLASNGVNGYIYPSGRSIGLAEYARRELMTGVMNTTRELSFARAAEWGSNLILISSHAGARPGCYPYQGRIFVRPGVEQTGYPSLEKDTTYGQPAGIFGINCRHYPTPWFEGLNDKPTEQDKNPAKKLNIDNRELYDLTQKQRYNERKIRAWKRRVSLQAEAGLEPEFARGKVKEWQKRQREFLKENDLLRRDYQRESV